MTYRQRQQAIVIDYNNGATIEELSEKYGFTAKNIQTLVRLKRLQINPDFFNVDEHDCWMIPTSSIIKQNKN